MATPDADSRLRLARLVVQRRVQLGWHKADAATASELTITTYMRIEKGLPVRDVTYAKIDRGLGWAPGACQAVLDGASEAQPAGAVIDGVRYAPGPTPAGVEDGVRRAVQDAVMATMPDTPAGQMAKFSEAVLLELQKRGIVDSQESSS